MIIAEFFRDEGELAGFSIRGHAGYADKGEDIVCASVSSAVQFAANLITDFFHTDASVTAVGDCINLMMTGSENRENSVVVIDGLKQHLTFLSEDFPGTISITFSEV